VPPYRRANPIPGRNFNASLRSVDVDAAAGDDGADLPNQREQQQTLTKGSGRPPPIILTPHVNLTKLKKVIKEFAKNNFEFRSTRNGIHVVTKDMTFSFIAPL
jgi:hypothetical protein